MTAVAEPLCGHRWHGPLCIHPRDRRPVESAGVEHHCVLPAGHHHTGGYAPRRCRCHCGATTREEIDR